MKTGEYLYNPTMSDIEVWSDKNGDNPQHYVLESGDIQRFEEPALSLIKTKLANKILWQNYPKDRNREKRLTEIYELIEVKTYDATASTEPDDTKTPNTS